MRRAISVLLVGAAAVIGSQAMAADPVMPPMGPAPPPPPEAKWANWTMLLELNGGVGEINSIEDPDDALYAIMGMFGAVNMGLGPRLNVQINGVAEAGIEIDDAETYGGVGFEMHVFSRNPSSMAFGIGQGIYFDQNDDDWNVHFTVAGEVAAYIGNLTLIGQGGYIGTLATEGNDRLQDAGFARVIGQYFVTPRFKIQGEVAYYRGLFDSDFDPFQAFGAGAELEFMLASAPVSFFVAWDALWHEDLAWGDTYATHQVVGGVRFLLGQDDLLSNNRNGVGFDLPNVIRLNALLGENN